MSKGSIGQFARKSKYFLGENGVTIKIAAEILCVSIATLRQWDKAGVLSPRRHKSNNYRLYRVQELEHFAEKNNLNRSQHSRIKFVP